MDVAQWTESGFDPIRARRLGVGFFLGAAVLASAVAVLASSGTPAAEQEEEPLEVVFGELPPEEEELAPEPEPEPEPEPPPVVDDPEPAVHGPLKAGPRAVEIDAAPTAVSTNAAEESDAPSGPIGSGSDPNQDPGGGGKARTGSTAPAPLPVPAPEPPPPPRTQPPPKKNKPARITEGMTPPKRIAGGAPGYPAAAKSQGIEGVVVVTYVVTETGAVTSVQAVRGPAELQAACVAAVSSWRFEPARDQNGNPVSARRVAKFPFRITTK